MAGNKGVDAEDSFQYPLEGCAEAKREIAKEYLRREKTGETLPSLRLYDNNSLLTACFPKTKAPFSAISDAW